MSRQVNLSQKIHKTDIKAVNPNVNVPQAKQLETPRAIGQTQKSENGSVKGFTINENQAFNRFVNQLENTPNVSEILTKAFSSEVLSKLANLSESSISEAYKNFLNSFSLSKEEVLNFIKYQDKNGSIFSGKFYDSLRGIDTYEGKENIGNLLKIIANKKDQETIINNIKQNLDQLSSIVTTSNAEELSTILNKINKYIEDKDYKELLKKLKQDVLPLLKQDMNMSFEQSKLRDVIMDLIHNMSRLEKSLDFNSLERLLNELKNNQNLLDSTQFDKLSKQVLDNSHDNKESNTQMEAFLKLISEGLSNKTESSIQVLFNTLIKTMMLNNHPAMELSHIFIPLVHPEGLSNAEIWVDKDGFRNSLNDNSLPSVLSIFVTLNIAKVGYFELEVQKYGIDIDLKLMVPSHLNDLRKTIGNSLYKLIEQNNLKVKKIQVLKLNKPRRVNEVFKHINDHQNAINVIV